MLQVDFISETEMPIHPQANTSSVVLSWLQTKIPTTVEQGKHESATQGAKRGWSGHISTPGVERVLEEEVAF